MTVCQLATLFIVYLISVIGTLCLPLRRAEKRYRQKKRTNLLDEHFFIYYTVPNEEIQHDYIKSTYYIDTVSIFSTNLNGHHPTCATLIVCVISKWSNISPMPPFNKVRNERFLECHLVCKKKQLGKAKICWYVSNTMLNAYPPS